MSTEGGEGPPESEGAEPRAPEGAEREGRSRAHLWRWLAVVALFVVPWVLAEFTGVTDRFEVEAVRRAATESGPWGVLVFLVLFSLGELVHVPGMVFVGGAILAWGRVEGFAVGFLGALLAVSVSFFVVRVVGGRALTGLRRPFVQRQLARLDAHPVRTVVVLRLVLWLLPAVNYALAMTGIRFRHYLVGSAVGLLPPVVLATVFFDWVFRLL